MEQKKEMTQEEVAALTEAMKKNELSGDLQGAAENGLLILQAFHMRGLMEKAAYEVCFGRMEAVDFFRTVINEANKQVYTFHAFIGLGNREKGKEAALVMS